MSHKGSNPTEDADVESQTFLILSGIRSALELAEEALALFEERRPLVMGYVGELPATGGKKIEMSRPGALTNRGAIGAQAFLSNMVIVENGLMRLAGLAGLPAGIQKRAELSLEQVKSVIDRKVRNTIEHIDDRLANAGTTSLVSGTLLEGDLLCSTRADGSVGLVAITRETFKIVVEAVNALTPV